MNRRGVVLNLVTFLFLSSMVVGGQRNQQTEAQRRARQIEESGNYLKNWPKEEVPYIIDSEEEAAWKGLKTDLEREQFIEAFWFRRDPTPDTIDNEFRDDYYRLIALANERYTSGIQGWRTDRGRILIMHGEPDEVETHAMGGSYIRDIDEGGGRTNTFPFERWRYRNIAGMGNNIILEFVDMSMSGEYKLSFDPSDKDALLHVPGAGLTENEERFGLDKADRLNRPHAVAGNPLGQDTRISPFDRLQQFYDIQKPPAVKFKDLETIVTSRISYNLLPFDYRADFLKMTETTTAVPITVQIAYKNFSFKEEGGFQVAQGRISATITGLTGRIENRFDDYIDLRVPSAQFRSDGIAVYQKVLNLTPKPYKLFIAVDDTRSKNTGTIDTRLEVKRFPEGNLAASSLILADRVEQLPPRTVSAQFQIGSLKVRPSVKNEFRRDQNMNVFLQVYGLKLDDKTHKPSVTTEVLILRDGQEVKKLTDDKNEVAGAAQQLNFLKEVALADLEPGQYDLQVKVTDNLSQTPLMSFAKFTVR